MLKTQDEQQRIKALDCTQSFIVQAPAGSGKTELLIQRFLSLLSSVKQPEEILAITFTKKSAAEMRTRIINALQNALKNPEPETPHAKKTWNLAKKVLQQDKNFNWNLLVNPNRLRLQTIDSFNASLTRQLPILSHFGATPDITNEPYLLYRKAVQEFLTHLEENQHWSNAIATILLHMDNDLNKVEELLINLLEKRDQWLRHITLNIDEEFLRKKLEEQLVFIVTDILEKLLDNFPEKYQEEMVRLVRYSVSFSEDKEKETLRLNSFPRKSIEDLQSWLAIRQILFTKNNEWRKKFEKDIGFPPASFFKSNEEKNHASNMKLCAAELIEKLQEFPILKNIFTELNHAPHIIYQEKQWETLEALHSVLRVLAAQLKLIFQETGKIDYIENSLAALTALGTEEAPTDLTLILDYQIKHILVDEFQDTSYSQYNLLKKITAGWEPHDGRTLFLVGDPMQSIYRFREAEVGIFIRAKKYGIGNIKLIPLTLSVNFRSTPSIVNWVNEHFPHVFPLVDDIATGAVSYSPSFSNQEKITYSSTVSLNGLIDATPPIQAQEIVSLIQKRKALNPEETIAILVRSRSHLEFIIPTLKKAGISFRAINIDPLTERPFIQDLIGLTRALLHPADRIAWLTILRAPWCGLSLSDLLNLTGDDPKIGLWERLHSAEIIQKLSPEGQIRLERFLSVLKIKIFERQRFNLRAWIESTWLLLGGPACIEQAEDLEDASTYFKLLSKLDQNGNLNLDLLEDYVNQLYAAPNNQADDKLQIMTIHNAKGLEFDTVILPHLERKASNDDKQLLLWMERTRADESNSLILAPVHAIGHDTDSIYEYIKREHAIKNEYEKSRLLYVAVTRAKKNLDLFFNLKEGSKIHSSSLLDKLIPSIQDKFTIIEKNLKGDPSEFSLYKPLDLRRLSLAWDNPIQENRLSETISYHQKKMGFILPDNTLKHIGTLTHQVLQQISLLGPDWWKLQSKINKSLYLKQHLLKLGALNRDINKLIININQLIENTLNDPRGQWILSSHREAQSEFKLTALVDFIPQQFIIDRTFIDENNIRWIIDYKTATNTSSDDLESFLRQEKEKYQKQMWYYYQAIKEIDSRPIRLGLYFPAIPAWHEWDFGI
ncbi:MAG TPA: UvrD-helicase domain-containing protein [Gammaproteobacteria bacterium]|nr:UvrD-helicase domain-containing protein [Gammaproteobacteria bacterium]